MRHELGKRVFYNPASEIYHHEGKTHGRSKHIMHNRQVFVERWRDRIRVDDAHSYAEDGFEATEYVKRGTEPHGETAAYVPELRELKSGAVVWSATRARHDGASQNFEAVAQPRPLNVGFSSMWYARGISFHTKQLAEALEGQHFTTHIFARWENDKFDNSGPIHHPRVFNAGDDPTPETIVRWASETKIGLMIFMEVHPKDWKRVEALKKAGVRVMCYENLDVLRLENWERYGVFDCFLFNAFYTREVMLGRFPGTSSLMIPWGTVPPENIEPGGALPGRPLRFVHVAGWGGINNRKNSDLLLRAFNRADVADAELHFFTQAPLASYGKVSERIVAVNPHIHVHEGTLENIFQAYHGMDMLLWPSKREGLGLPIVEALASGLPVLVTDGWMMKEWIVPGEHGVLCPAVPEQGRTFLPEMQVDESELARLIGELAGDRERVHGMAANVSRDRDLWRWNWQPSVFREQLDRLLMQPGYIPPETLDYLPETARPPTCTIADSGSTNEG
jgi:glycosyltransferase involved in cell wall biosynthesis